MSNKLLFSIIFILSSCPIATAGGINEQDSTSSIQDESVNSFAPELSSDTIIHDITPTEVVVQLQEMAPPSSMQDVVIHATIICDNPPAGYQEQLRQSGAKILEVENSTSGEGDEAVQVAMVKVEVADYDVLNLVGQLNFVMRVDSIKELAGIADKISEGDRWILGLPDSEMVEAVLILSDASVTDVLREEEDMEIIDKVDTVLSIRCSMARLKKLAALEEIAAISVITGRE